MLEVLIAAALLASSLAAISSVQLAALRATEDAGRALRGVLLARDYLERQGVTDVPPALSEAAASADGLGAEGCVVEMPCSARRLGHGLLRGWLLRTAADRGGIPGLRFCADSVAHGLRINLSWPRLGRTGSGGPDRVCGHVPAQGAHRALALTTYLREIP